LALKGNHPHLHQRLKQFFSNVEALQYIRNQGSILSSIQTENKGHGPQEKRIILATHALDWIDKKERGSVTQNDFQRGYSRSISLSQGEIALRAIPFLANF